MKDIETFLWGIELSLLISSGCAFLLAVIFIFATHKDSKFVGEAWDKTRRQLYDKLGALREAEGTSKDAEGEYWQLNRDLDFGREYQTIMQALPVEARKKYDRIEFLASMLRFFGGLFSFLILTFFVLTGLWVPGIIYGLLVMGMAVSAETSKGQGMINILFAIITNAVIVSGILFLAQGSYTSTPPSIVFATQEVTTQEKAIGAPEPVSEHFKLVGSVNKSNKHGNLVYSWSDALPDGASRSFSDYTTDDAHSRTAVKIVEDLPEGTEPYVTHKTVFSVLQGKDKDTPLCTRDSYTPPCSNRNAWFEKTKATIHLPKGKYGDYVKVTASA